LKKIIDDFHNLYFEKRAWLKTSWLGVPVLKCPFDLWIYQEIITSVKPDIIIECGTAHGGSALYLASVCDLINHGRIITIDIRDNQNRPDHKRIKYLKGSSISAEKVEQVKREIHKEDTVLVILDSLHKYNHVLQELELYKELVTPGSYLIVEDTNINGHPIRPGCGKGPMEAVEEFLENNKEFTVDRSKEKFMLTFNPNGYLKKIE
jgi:cephalosporin hydroxylase